MGGLRDGWLDSWLNAWMEGWMNKWMMAEPWLAERQTWYSGMGRCKTETSTVSTSSGKRKRVKEEEKKKDVCPNSSVTGSVQSLITTATKQHK